MSQSAKIDFSMILDQAGAIVKAEGNTLIPLGMPAARTLGMPFSEFVVAEEQILTSEMISQVLMTGQSSTFIVYLESMNGGIAAFNMSVLVAPGNQSCQATFQSMPDIKYQPIGRDSVDDLSDAVDALLYGDVEDDLDLTFIDVGDIDQLGAESIDAFTDRVEESLRDNSYDGTVTRIDDSKYTVVHDTEVSSELIGAGMTEVAQEFDPGGTALKVETATVGLSNDDVDRSQIGDTVRYAVEQFKENGVEAIQQDSLAGLQQAADDQHKVEVTELRAAATENRLTFQFSPVFHLASGRVEHIQVEPGLMNDEVSLTPFKVEGYVAEDDSLGALIDTATAQHLGGYASTPEQVPQGTYLSSTFPVQSLLQRDVIASLMTIAQTRPILRIHGLDQTLLQRANELQTLRSAGFLVCLHGYEVGAVNEEKLQSLPMDFVSMDSQLTGDARTFASRIPILQQMASICAKYQIRMLFQGIVDPAILPMLKQIDGSLATGQLFGAPAESAMSAAAVIMPA
jgi:predicted signal transduction protein with EAL and GGDEF domain